MPSEPPRPGDGEPDEEPTRSSSRPLSRGDLFGPGGPLTAGSRPADGEDEPTVAYRPGDDATVAYRPGEGAPEQTRAYRSQPEITPPTTPGPYQPGYDQGHDQNWQQPADGYTPGGYEPGQYQPGDPRNPYAGGYGQGGYPPDPYGQGGYGQHEYGPQYAAGGPPPRNRSAALAAALVLAVGVVAALAIYVFFGDRPGDEDTAAPGASPSAAPSPAASSPAQGEDEPSPSPSERETDPADYEPIPDQPWTDDSLDFGLLTEVKRDGDEVRLTVNRATFLYGDEATEKNGGEAPENDYLIEDTNPKLRTFVLRPDAPLNGSDRLADAGADGRDLELDEFVEAARRTLAENRDNDGGVPVWLRHEGNDQEGPVTALKEQFLP